MPGGAMQGLIIGVIGVWIGGVGLSWAEVGTSTPQAEWDRVMAMAAHPLIVMQGRRCQKPDGPPPTWRAEVATRPSGSAATGSSMSIAWSSRRLARGASSGGEARLCHGHPPHAPGLLGAW
jgi:hypothetical protein